jgi:hypothetical protein
VKRDRAGGGNVLEAMNATSAQIIARSTHAGQRTRTGRPLIDHIERVAAAVAPEARTVAFLHDVLERTPTPLAALRLDGLDDVEVEALELLTRSPGESYELYVLRIAHAPGEAGRLARAVKLADLDDHLGEPWAIGAPPYAWARRHIVNCQERRDGLVRPTSVAAGA